MYLIQTMHLSVSLLFLLLSYSLRYSPLWEWSTIEAFLIYRFLLWRFRFSYLFTRILANLSDRAQAVTKCWNGRYTISTISVGRYTHLNISGRAMLHMYVCAFRVHVSNILCSLTFSLLYFSLLCPGLRRVFISRSAFLHLPRRPFYFLLTI
jgi:hypothetical protein